MLDEVARPHIVDVLSDRTSEDHLPEPGGDDVVLYGDVVLCKRRLGADEVLDPREEVWQPGVEPELAAELAQRRVVQAREVAVPNVREDVVEVDRVFGYEVGPVAAVELG